MSLLDRLLEPFRDPDPAGEDFDRAFGVETRWYDLFRYEPTPPDVCLEAFRALPARPEDHTFVDLGSGKGRVVLLAATRPFRTAVGVEHRAALHAAALRNLDAFRPHARCPVAFLHGDAAEQPLPAGPLVLWMFNPFGADVIAPALARLSPAHAHWLVYVVPRELPVVVAAGFRPVAEGGPDDCRWVVLRRPALSPPAPA